FSERQLHTPTNLLLLSLAVSDLLVGLVLMPGEMLRESGCWLLGELVCALYLYVAYVAVSASVIDMVLISVDRYVAICDPLHYSQRVTMRRVSVGVACSWAFSFLYTALILKDNLLYPERTRTCWGECMLVFDFVSAAVDVFVGFILPVGLILAINLVVLVVALSQARAMRVQVVAHASQRVARRPQLKAARSLGVLVGIFLLCFTPYQCFSLVGGDLLQSPVASFLVFLVYVNSCVNPLVYALFYPWFRKAVRLISMSLLHTHARACAHTHGKFICIA
uniref:G-protein coupled receptors family 1 profile domain-containing protein n=1 Tax=Periophthalmus magnuspinnatus TaxID=409849 RepID=A0A3B3Z7J6_9GOBI